MQTPGSSPAGGDSLPSSFYNIDPTRDTTIATAKGARLTIPAGAFGDSAADVASGAAAGMIRIEIKEAYTIADMIRGRLITTTHGAPLSSGGMIYVNVAGATPMALRKPIKVAIPTKGIQEGMQLYKGAKDDKGQIDWVDPKPLTKTGADSDLATGKALFTTNCASCHGIGKALTGPALGWIGDREHDKRWLHDIIHNNRKLLARNDPYACYLFNRYNKTPMNVFPDLSDKGIDMLLQYVANASQTIDSNTVPNYRKSFDSCVRYSRLAALLKKRSELIRRRALKIAENGPEVVEKMDGSGIYMGSTPDTLAPPPPPPQPPVLDYKDHASVYYQFEIDATGWYNCDRLLEGIDGVAESTLWVRVTGMHRQEANVYLVVPGVKVLMFGGKVPDSTDVYAFHTLDGRMLLPQGQPAFILCMGEDKGQPFWGKVQWTISLSQELTVEPATMSKGAINTAIAQLHIEDLSITARDSKNATEIRSIDKETRVTDSLLKTMAGLKPMFCDCDCHLGEAQNDSAWIEYVPLRPPVPGK